jgi:predicted nucleic acid-binding protein
VPEAVCDVSPIQYLHQAGLLDLLRLRYGGITIPTAVAAELGEGTRRGVDLPSFESLDWIRVRQPTSRLLLPIVTDLGAGEREVLALGVESADSIVILDDALARRYARLLNLMLTGTLGVLLKSKETGHLPAVAPVLDRLEQLRFRLDPETRQAVLKLAGEA